MQVPVYAGVKMTDKDGRVTFSLEQPTKLSGTSTGGRKTEENTSKPQPVVDPVNEKIAKILEENIYHAVNRSRDWLSPVKPINAINFSNFMNHIGSYSASLKTSLDTIKDGYHKAHAAGQFDNVVPGQRQAMRNDIIKELEKMPKEKRVQMINETREFGHLVFDLNQPPALPAPAPAGA
jgi:hypothetical protein